MPTPGDEIIRYDGRTLAVSVCPLVEVEARRGRRWGWFGRKGWWIHLSLFHGWHMRKFVHTLAEAGGIFFKDDPDVLPWFHEEPGQSPSMKSGQASPDSDPPLWESGAPFFMF